MNPALSHDWFPIPLPSNVTLADRSWWYSSYSCLHFKSRQPNAVRVGHDTGIYHGTFFDLGPQGEVQIGNFCTLVGAIISTNARVEIGDYTFIAHEVVLADSISATPSHNARVDVLPLPRGEGRGEGTALHTRILKKGHTERSIFVAGNCWIGARAILLAGARIGEGAIIGAATLVDFEVPPFSIVAGNPARIVGETKSG